MSETKETFYQRNREKQLALAKEYRKNNLEKQKAYWKTYYAENRETLLQKRREYAATHREANKEKQKIYWSEYQKKKKDTRGVFYDKNPLVVEAPLSPVVLDPTVEIPQSTMIVSRGNHMVTFN